jgi:PBP1b-binding outer membrane lipoprotein LpoB
MNKKRAYAMIIIGGIIFVGCMIEIYNIYLETKEKNANTTKPEAFMVIQNAPICNCSVDHSLAWNALFGIAMGGMIITGNGLLQLRFLKRKF